MDFTGVMLNCTQIYGTHFLGVLCPASTKSTTLLDNAVAFEALSTSQVLFISLALFVINITYLILIFVRRRYLNMKAVSLYLSLAINDLLAGLWLLVLCVFMFQDLGDIAPWIHLMMQVQLTGSIAITAATYFHIFLIQAIAIRRPILYRTRFTTRVRICCILGPWLFGFAYTFIKGYSLYDCMNCVADGHRSRLFSKYEVGAMILAIILTTSTYSYVIYTAYIRLKERGLRLNKQKHHRRQLVRIVFKEYRTVTTAGLHLAAYLFFFVPLCVVWIRAVADDRNIYTCGLIECKCVFVVWFCRGVVDPFIQVAREPKLKFRWQAFSQSTSKSIPTSLQSPPTKNSNKHQQIRNTNNNNIDLFRSQRSLSSSHENPLWTDSNSRRMSTSELDRF